MFCCEKLCAGINKKSAWITSIVVFIFIFISDFIIHGNILKNAYEQTAHLWRTEQAMQDYFLWMLLAQFLIAKFFTLLYARGCENGGVKEALRFACFIAPFAIAPYFIQYAVIPLPASILWAWVGFGIVQIFGAAAVAGLVYKK